MDPYMYRSVVRKGDVADLDGDVLAVEVSTTVKDEEGRTTAVGEDVILGGLRKLQLEVEADC